MVVTTTANCRILRTDQQLSGIVPVQTTDKSVTDERKNRTVHFADTKGLALTSIFHFAKESYELRGNRRKLLAYLKDLNNNLERGSPARLLNFKSSVPYDVVKGHVSTRNVCLESAVCYRFGIYGRVFVRNLAFEKTVFVRYTFDAWKSRADEQAMYIQGASTGETDSFFFHVRPPPIITENRKMEFAICYRVNGMEFWDNNHGDDYRLVYFQKDPVEIAISNELATNRNI